MKTALLTGSFLDGQDGSGSLRVERVARYLEWYRPLLSALDADEIYLSDNASFLDSIGLLKSKGTFLRYTNHLTKGTGPHDYPYCWRIIYTIKILITLGYEKIIFIDSDCFVVSRRLLMHLRAIETGWQTFWVESYGFPSAELQVLCQDAFPLYERFTSLPMSDHFGKLMEWALPFTHVNKDFRVDRWGEKRVPWGEWMDAYAQAPVGLALGFNEMISSTP